MFLKYEMNWVRKLGFSSMPSQVGDVPSLSYLGSNDFLVDANVEGSSSKPTPPFELRWNGSSAKSAFA